MAVTEELLVKLKIDANGAIKGTKVAVDGLKGLGTQVKRTENMFTRLKTTLEQTALPIIALNQAFGVLSTVMHTVGRAVDATLGNFAKFETALVGVAKTTELGGAELEQFGKTIQDLSEDIPVSANQLLKFAEIAGQLGVRGTENLRNFADTMARIEVSTNLAGEEAAKQFTRILTVTKESIENIDEFASVIVRLGNNFAANEEEITRVTTEVARSIGVFKGSAAEAAALATALRVLGNRAELGGTVVGRVFRKIDSTIKIGTEAAKKNLSELTGIAVEDLRKSFEEDAGGAFVKFLEGLKRVEEGAGSIDLTLQQFKLTGDEINKVIPALTTRLDVFRDALRQANEEAGDANALTEESRRAFDTLASAYDKAGNSLTNLGTDIGAFFAPFAEIVLNAVAATTQFFRAIINIENKMGAFAATLTSLALGLAVSVVDILTAPLRVFTVFSDRLDAMFRKFDTKVVDAFVSVWDRFTGQTDEAADAQKELNKRIEASADSLDRLDQDQLDPLIQDVKDVEKELVKVNREFQNLINKTTELERETAGVFATDKERIEQSTRFKLEDIAALEMQLKKLGQIEGKEEEIARARAAVQDSSRVRLLEIERKELEKLANAQLQHFDNVLTENKKIQNQIEATGASQIQNIELRMKAQVEEIELKLADLRIDEEITAEIENQFELQIKLVKELAAKRIEIFKIKEAEKAAEKARQAALKAEKKLQEEINREIKRRADLFKNIDKQIEANATRLELSQASEFEAIGIRADAMRRQVDMMEKELGFAVKTREEVEKIARLRQQIEVFQFVAEFNFRTDVLNQVNEDIAAIQQEINLFGLEGRDLEEAILGIRLATLEAQKQELMNAGVLTQGQFELLEALEKRKQKLIELDELSRPTTVGDVASVTGGALADFGAAAIDPKTYEAVFDKIEEFNQEQEAFAMLSKEEQGKIQLAGAKEAGLAIWEGAKMAAEAIGSITLEDIGQALMATAEFVADIMSGIISGEFVQIMTDVVNAFTDFPSMMLEVFSNFGQALMRFAESFPQLVQQFIQQFPVVIQQIIDAIPKVVDALVQNLPLLVDTLVTGLVKAIPVIAQGLADVLPVVLTTLSKAIGPIIIALTDAIPVIIEGLMTAITESLPFLVESLVLAFQNLLDRLPDIVDAIIDNLPALVEALVEAAVVLALKFVEAVIDFFLSGGAERIIVSIIKVVPKLILAIANGLANALRKVFGGTDFGISIGGDFGEFEQKIVGGVKRIADEATGVADELFKVVDARNAAQKSNFIGDVNEAVDRIATSFNESGDSFGLKIKQAWDNIIRFFKEDFGLGIAKAWKQIIELFENIGGIISAAWKRIIDFFSDLPANLAKVWHTILEELKNIPELLKAGFKSFMNAVNMLIDAVALIFEGIGMIGTAIFENVIKPIADAIWKALNPFIEGFKTMFNTLKSTVFDPIVEGFKTVFGKEVFDGIVNILKAPINAMISLINSIKIPPISVKHVGEIFGGMDLVPGEIERLNTGGFVTGDQSQNADSALRLLTPGEFVINRPAARMLGPNVLNTLNSGRMPGNPAMSPTFNIDLRVDAGNQQIDEDFIRSRLVPSLMDAIKEQSLDGRFVMSLGGLR